MRKLTLDEITQLQLQSCSADDWQQITVADDFSTEYLHKVKFTGINTLGVFDTSVSLQGGVKIHTGIYDAWLHNCTVGNNVLIRGVRDYIANYIIEDEVVIFNVNLVLTDGQTTFGNGIKVETISEAGTRSVMMYNQLSAHLAYILASYRHRPQLIEKFEALIEAYAQAQKVPFGRISYGVKIMRCATIMNVNIGPCALLDGADSLRNGTINSVPEDPVVIGDACHLENFIVCSGTQILNGTVVSNSFVGQGCLLDKQYSSVQSLFFANCQGFHGEACAIFAGPYTVTHHKSTLLIAGMYSFMNAGSGSNQSNHLYKLGPIHHGFLERGTKTTSDSYILWPSRIGAFTLVMGRHSHHADTADFPFSYMIERDDASYLAPAVNLRSIGTIRDSQKWPKRDLRKSKLRLDHINYNLLSPYTVGKMIRGRDILLEMRDAKEGILSEYEYKGVKIETRIMSRSINLYEYALWKFLGNSVISRLEKTTGILTDELIRKSLQKDTDIGSGNWVDIAGLICPASALNSLLDCVERGTETSLEKIEAAFVGLHRNYYTYEWTWAFDVLEKFYGKRPDEFTSEDVRQVVQKWISGVLAIDDMLYEDAQKEFTLSKKAGFGADGNEEDKEKDFANVRGKFHTNPTVVAITEHKKEKEALGKSIIERMV
ncbi:MAG: DUF4954 family protein [Bacteroidales bacterium]|nr:DUF4954 family protein [Bacteroidales bacterium]MCL2133290.1 DUF4954 family protein [Bacteroidales bacterium]